MVVAHFQWNVEWSQNIVQCKLIEEKTNRTFYGGAIGFMDFEGNFNHAIMHI
jgi:hypothetical protein